MKKNPLLNHKGAPLFHEIKNEHVVPAVRALLQNAAKKLEEIEESPHGEARVLLSCLEEIENDFVTTWGTVNHLLGVKNSTELRSAYELILPEVIAFQLRMAQSSHIYFALKRIKEGVEWKILDDASRRVIDHKLLAAKNSGIELEGETKKRFNEIVSELAALSTDFSNHLLDATKAYRLDLKTAIDVAGLPDSLLVLLAENYNTTKDNKERKATPESGPWRVTLDMPSYLPFMKFSKNRPLREKIYRAYITRASSGKDDNTPVIYKIIRLSQEMASILGYSDYVSLSLSEKMAADINEVKKLLKELRDKSWKSAEQDLSSLRVIAGEYDIPGELQLWDIAFLTERLREREFNFSEEELRPYFPLQEVLKGLFSLAEKIFSIKIKPSDGRAPVWHNDVYFFDIFDEENNHRASFFLDPYSRPGEKRGGAWMGECLNRRQTPEGLQKPIAYLICNFTPRISDEQPSLLTFQEIETLFHEFGHGLQHMLTTVDLMGAAGINGVEWDAVEVPSQFMENWCYHKPTLVGLSKHTETGDSLPDRLFEAITKARIFQAGSLMLRQLKFSFLDLELYHKFDPDGKETIFDVQKRIEKQTALMPSLSTDRFLCSFAHIFAGGYSAGYYSYKWAEVLSADTFSAFKEAGLDDPVAIAIIGKQFRDTVLASGGSLHPLEIFKKFRGRPPQLEPLLEQYGIK